MNPLTHTPLIDNDLIHQLLQQNGPEPEQYKDMFDWYQEIWNKHQSGEITEEEVAQFRDAFGELYNTTETLQGFVLSTPHGYSGDYEIIERFYTNYTSPRPKFQKWDACFQTCKAIKALRNRKAYFKNLLQEKSQNKQQFRVLNLASGPCRDLLEFYEENPKSTVQFDCIELDKNAIQYASDLLGEHAQNVNFIHQNIFKFRTSEKYDLIWSAGLFDYFDDRTFVRILSRFLNNEDGHGYLACAE